LHRQRRNFAACCFDIVAIFGNNVEATFDLVAFDNVASTVLLVWTGFNEHRWFIVGMFDVSEITTSTRERNLTALNAIRQITR